MMVSPQEGEHMNNRIVVKRGKPLANPPRKRAREDWPTPRWDSSLFGLVGAFVNLVEAADGLADELERHEQKRRAQR
jgi:hypothetical protein